MKKRYLLAAGVGALVGAGAVAALIGIVLSRAEILCGEWTCDDCDGCDGDMCPKGCDGECHKCGKGQYGCQQRYGDDVYCASCKSKGASEEDWELAGAVADPVGTDGDVNWDDVFAGHEDEFFTKPE